MRQPAHNKRLHDARGPILAGYYECKDMLKQFLARSLAQCRAASFTIGGGGTALRVAADVSQNAASLERLDGVRILANG